MTPSLFRAQPADSRLTGMRRDAEEIFAAALGAVDPAEAVRRHVRVADGALEVQGRRLELGACERVRVIGAGKASAPMARALEDLLGDRIDGGAVVVKDGHGERLGRIRILEAAHPLPDRRGVAATAAILEEAGSAGENDLLLCLISGGGSALLVSPADGITLEDQQDVTRMLLACGAGIHDINTVRKHLSRVKGGQLARAAHPAALVSLILSDVVGDDLDVIASGPTVPDPTTFCQAETVLKRYGIWGRAAPSIRARIADGVAGRAAETPKPGDAVFARCLQVLVGTNFQALAAAARAARGLGYSPLVLTSRAEGEAREAARLLAAVAREVRASGHPVPPPACLLMGGETTVTVRGSGRGGRNQEFALAAALALEGLRDAVVLAAGTDGTDGPTPAAGALVDGGTAARARAQGIDARGHLDRNDSHLFFQRLGGLLVTGPTRTNVMDVYLALVDGLRPGE